MRNREIALVRCRSIGSAEQKIFSQLSASKILDAVYYVVDNYSGEQDIPDDPSIFELNRDFIDRLGLKYLGSKTGWVMGDYALYRALEVDWSHCWLFEPDMKLPSDLDNFLQEHIDLGTDLVCVGFRPVSNGWHWTANIERLSSREIDFYAMAFGPLRLSRPLVVDGMDFRREILSNMTESQTAMDSANDESVMASIAALKYSVSEFDHLRLKYFNAESFRFHEDFNIRSDQLVHPVVDNLQDLYDSVRGSSHRIRIDLNNSRAWKMSFAHLGICLKYSRGYRVRFLILKYFLHGILVK